MRRKIRRLQLWLEDHGWSLAFALAGGVILLSLALLLAGCGRGSLTGSTEAIRVEEPDDPAWRQDRSDLLNYFLGHGREDKYLRAKGHNLSLEWQGGQFSGESRYTKWATAHEHHRWDAAMVYLVEDETGAGNYSFSNGIFFSRRAKPGDSGRADSNQITWYNADCSVKKVQSFRFEWRFVGFQRAALGGATAEQDYAIIAYIWGPGREERFWYGWDDGWVRWQYIENGELLNNFTFNLPGEQVPHGTECAQ